MKIKTFDLFVEVILLSSAVVSLFFGNISAFLGWTVAVLNYSYSVMLRSHIMQDKKKANNIGTL